MPQIVKTYIEKIKENQILRNLTPILSDIRMIKSNYEIQLARHAGQVANAMMLAGRETIRDMMIL